jgi:hypothetical protein
MRAAENREQIEAYRSPDPKSTAKTLVKGRHQPELPSLNPSLTIACTANLQCCAFEVVIEIIIKGMLGASDWSHVFIELNSMSTANMRNLVQRGIMCWSASADGLEFFSEFWIDHWT